MPAGGATDDVLKYLVAEDFFAACGKEPRRMMPAVVAAVKVSPGQTAHHHLNRKQHGWLLCLAASPN